jgi:hypothetical protein
MWTLDTYYELQKAKAFVSERLDEITPTCYNTRTIEASNELWYRTLLEAKENALKKVEGEVNRVLVRVSLDNFFPINERYM